VSKQGGILPEERVLWRNVIRDSFEEEGILEAGYREQLADAYENSLPPEERVLWTDLLRTRLSREEYSQKEFRALDATEKMRRWRGER